MNDQFQKAKELYQHRLYSFAYYSLRVREDAEDLTQEVLLRLWQHWDGIDQERLPAWLMQVAHHLVVDHVRRRRRLLFVEAELDDFPCAGAALDRDGELFRKIVEQSIARLNDPYRTTVILRDIQACSYREIAEILRTSEAQVKTDLFRGRGKLRKLVKMHKQFSPELLAASVEQ